MHMPTCLDCLATVDERLFMSCLIVVDYAVAALCCLLVFSCHVTLILILDTQNVCSLCGISCEGKACLGWLTTFGILNLSRIPQFFLTEGISMVIFEAWYLMLCLICSCQKIGWVTMHLCIFLHRDKILFYCHTTRREWNQTLRSQCI